MNTKWQGLWSQEREAYYAGPVIKKADIPKYTRLVLRYNKLYKADSNRPRFVYFFADAEGYEDRCVPIELEERKPYLEDDVYYTGEGDRLYTEEEVRAIINGTVADVKYGISDPYDILPSDFV